MNNNQVTRLSIVTLIAACLLVVGVITAVGMVEQADAAKKNKTVIINRDSVTSNADGADGASGTSSADGADGADGGVAIATIPQ